jgi:hypothetical protein
MRHYLLWCDASSDEDNITSWQSQDRLLQAIVTQLGKLLATDRQDWVFGVVGGKDEGVGGRDGVVEYESPTRDALV